MNRFIGFRMCALILVSLLITNLSAQNPLDECLSAMYIPDVADYCSGEIAFNNMDASASSEQLPFCWDAEDAESDVWFYVRPRRAGLLIRAFGQSASNPNNTLEELAIAIYNGTCTDLQRLACREIPSGIENSIEIPVAGLTIGAPVYIRVSSSLANAGSFELCIEEFNPVVLPESDCGTSVVLCDKSTFFVENLNSTGENNNELEEGNCINSEFASAWYTWTVENSGTLTFVLTPTSPDPNEDLDFAIYRLPNGVGDCNNKELVRCMASGESQGNSAAANALCLGPTGLRTGATDISEVGGCMTGDDNFIAPLDMIEGETYALIVNNFSQSTTGSNFGFTIDFGGTGSFQGPSPDFNIVANQGFQCDQQIIFQNMSESPTDQIVSYSWNFGEGAIPETATGSGPHNVIYATFGEKLAALTIETSRGCLLTDIQELDIATCCLSTDEIDISTMISNPLCSGDQNAIAQVSVGSGSSFTLYSFENGEYFPNNIFTGLGAGSYSIMAIDAKGCEGSTILTLEDPAPLELSLRSELDTVLLGTGTNINATSGPTDRTFSYLWTPIEGLTCTDCTNPFAIPPGTTTYNLEATDQDGCSIIENITIFTNNIKRFYAPNAVNLSSSLGNERFLIDGNIAIEIIEELIVYDRWGGILHQIENLVIGDPNYQGWDGRVNGKKVNPGVYVWVASIRYIDGEIENISGDVTIFD